MLLAPLAGIPLSNRGAATPSLKSTVLAVDHECVDTDAYLPVKAGPVPDRIAIWPVDDGPLRT
jgi:hypothetical protein